MENRRRKKHSKKTVSLHRLASLEVIVEAYRRASAGLELSSLSTYIFVLLK